MTLKIRRLKNTHDVFDIEVKDNHNFFANNILVHNCVEILQTTVPLKSVEDPDGRIALCTLSALNWGMVSRKEDLEKYCNLTVRGLNQILDYQEYPIRAAKEATIDYRSLGIGITNFAYWLAKNGLTYQHVTTEDLQLIDEWVEAFAFYITKASVELAEETGRPCRKWKNTKYSLGLVPMDYRKMSVDELVPHEPKMPWDTLRGKMKVTGIMNTPLMAQAPNETSSQTNGSGSTNGIEPPRALVSSKRSKEGVLTQVVPGIQRYKNRYDLLWEQTSPTGYTKIMAIMQKYFDNGISVNQSFNLDHYPNRKIPESVILGNIIDHYRWGGKTMYYLNTNDNASDDTKSEGQLPLIPIEEVDDDDCISCKL